MSKLNAEVEFQISNWLEEFLNSLDSEDKLITIGEYSIHINDNKVTPSKELKISVSELVDVLIQFENINEEIETDVMIKRTVDKLLED